jgi:nucleoid-associated protein YgaU
MIERFSRRLTFLNEDIIYKDYLRERNKKSILQYSSDTFKYPSQEQLNNISFIEHYWSAGDRLYKLSEKYYGDSTSWWVILRFNKIGSEFLINAGDLILIPRNADEFMSYVI